MKNYFDGYMAKSIQLLRLCVQAKKNGIRVNFSFSSNSDSVNIDHWKSDGTLISLYAYLDWDNGEETVNEMIAYLKSLKKVVNNDT